MSSFKGMTKLYMS